MSDEKGETAPALGISLNAQLDARRQLVLQTHVPAEYSEEQITKLVSTYNRVIDKQVAYYQVEELENNLERDKQILYSINRNLEDVEAMYAKRYESGNKRGNKLSENEEKQRKQAIDNVKRQTEIVALSERRLKEAKEKAGLTDGTPSTANS